MGSSRELQAIASLLLWSVNQELAARTVSHLLVHGACAAHGSRAVAIPGASGAGKSTLVTSLVRSGWSYVTDEAIAFTGDGSITPYRRPITLKPGSFQLFPELDPIVPEVRPPFTTSRWHLPPSMLERNPPPESVRLQWLFFPERRPGPPKLEPIGRAESITEMLRNALNPQAVDQGLLDGLAKGIGEDVGCFHLGYETVEDAVDAIRSLARSD